LKASRGFHPADTIGNDNSRSTASYRHQAAMTTAYRKGSTTIYLSILTAVGSRAKS
jgi:hypothetical protein